MPRVIVFRLNGGGDVTPLGAVERPFAVVVVPVVGGVTPVVGGVVPVLVVVVALGDTSGEKIPPSAHSERLRPYCFTLLRLTSMISMSTTISARGLSFCWMIFSKIPTTDGVARMVMEFDDLFGAFAGCTARPGGRNAMLSSCTGPVASEFDG